MKSKFNFFLSVLLVLVFGMALNTCSYAVVSEEFIGNYLTKQVEYYDSQTISSSSVHIKIADSFKLLNKTELAENINLILSQNNLEWYDKNIVFIQGWAGSYTGSYNNIYSIYVFNFNNTRGDNSLPFFGFTNSLREITINGLTDSSANEYLNFQYLKLTFNTNSSGSIATLSSITLNSSNNLTIDVYKGTATLEELTNYSSPMVYAEDLAGGYYYYSNTNNFIPVLITGDSGLESPQSDIEIPPDEPENPDDSGGSGSTGTITNPSGDTTGKVDLNGIEQGIGAVKDAVNNVTNTIKDAFTFDSGDAKEVMQEFENTDLGLSQDLYDLNDQFFELFETEEMDDFKISWNGVNYQEAQLIPSGEINFSALCRENEQIGKVKEYITLFAIVGASFTLLKVIWNMIAEMLGLNQTLMETDFGDAVMYTYEDNSYDIDTRAYLDSKRYNKRR